MTNPFAALQVYGDDDQTTKIPKQNTKKVSEFKKQEKVKQAPRKQQTGNQADNLPTRVRDNATVIRNKRQPKPTKEIGEGHTLDRRSGTGRIDKPRKQGGGRGGIGNLHDEQNKEKYLKQGEQQKEEQKEEVKPEEPQGLTLQEYYRNKGIELQNMGNLKKQPIKKGQVNAEWIKKEKLTVIETKEDKKLNERVNHVTKKQFNQPGEEKDGSNNAILGFKSKTEQRPREDQKDKHFNKGKKQKINLKEEDFPSL